MLNQHRRRRHRARGGTCPPTFGKSRARGGTVSPSLRWIRWLLYTYINEDHDKKPILCLKQSAKTHVEQSRISKIFPIPLIQRIMHLTRQQVKVKRCVVKTCEWQERGVWWGITRCGWMKGAIRRKRGSTFIGLQCTGVANSRVNNIVFIFTACPSTFEKLWIHYTGGHRLQFKQILEKIISTKILFANALGK